MIVIKVGNEFPKTCEDCPIFENDIVGHAAYCTAGGEYTDEEIDAEKDGDLNMYYHGYLNHRPKNCPLIEMKVGEKE